MSKNLKYILIGIGIIILGIIFWYFKSIISYLIVSAILALIGNPLVDFLSKIKIKQFTIPRSVSAGITLAVFWVLLLTFFRIFIPLIADQAKELSSVNTYEILKSLKGPVSGMEDFIGTLPVTGGENFSVQSYLSDKITSIVDVSMLSDFFGSLTGAMGDIFIAIFSISFISFFFLKDKGLFSQGILVFTPVAHEVKMKKVFISSKKLLIRYFIGLAIEVCLITILVSTGLYIAGLNFDTAVVVGLFAGIMNVIPYVGPIIGAIFGIVIGIATHLNLEFYTELLPLIGYIVIVFMIVQIIDNIFFQPLIYSSSVNAHPLEIFLVISVAGSLAGITGMIVAVPVYTLLRVIAREFLYGFKIVRALTEHIE